MWMCHYYIVSIFSYGNLTFDSRPVDRMWSSMFRRILERFPGCLLTAVLTINWEKWMKNERVWMRTLELGEINQRFHFASGLQSSSTWLDWSERCCCSRCRCHCCCCCLIAPEHWGRLLEAVRNILFYLCAKTGERGLCLLGDLRYLTALRDPKDLRNLEDLRDPGDPRDLDGLLELRISGTSAILGFWRSQGPRTSQGSGRSPRCMDSWKWPWISWHLGDHCDLRDLGDLRARIQQQLSGGGARDQEGVMRENLHVLSDHICF